jgi:hypothetical protein
LCEIQSCPTVSIFTKEITRLDSTQLTEAPVTEDPFLL